MLMLAERTVPGVGRLTLPGRMGLRRTAVGRCP